MKSKEVITVTTTLDEQIQEEEKAIEEITDTKEKHEG